MEHKNWINDLPIFDPGKQPEEIKREYNLTEVFRMDSNENPFGSSLQVQEMVIREAELIRYYPISTSPALREKLALNMGIDPNCIIVGNGSDEIVKMLARTYLSPGDEAIMADKTFHRYEIVTKMEEGIPVHVPLKEGVHDLQAMARAVTPKTRIIWVCNPNNPTSTMVSHEDLSHFLSLVPPHILVVIDEAYIEYIVDPSYPDSLSLLQKDPRLFILRTFSKMYGLAGLRVGYGMGHPDIVAALQRVCDTFNVNRLAQQAALVSLEDTEFVAYCQKQNRLGIHQITEQWDQLGFSYFPAYGNFILLHTPFCANEVFSHLLRQGIVVRPGSVLGYPTSIRVTVGTSEQNERFLNAFMSFVEMKVL